MVQIMQDIIFELQDMRHLSWEKTRKSSGTAGSFLKAYDDSGKKKLYYKLSNFDAVKGIAGHECVNEIIVQRLLRKYGIEHLEYKLIHATIRIKEKEYETWLCESEDYKNPGETKIALEDYYQMEMVPGEDPLEFCIRKGWAEQIYKMLIVDHIVLNRDRHGANIEVLRSPKEKSIRLAPLFDHGLSFVCRCANEEELANFDVLKDLPVQAFIGSGSTYENVRKVPKSYINSIPVLTENDREMIFSGLDRVMGKAWLDKIWEMIARRRDSLDNL